MKYSVEIANNINGFLESINSEIYLSCVERKARSGAVNVAGSWKKRNISCDPKYPNIVDITETQVKNFLKKNYGVNLLTLIKSVDKAKQEYDTFFKKAEKQIIKTPLAADVVVVDSIESKLDTIIELLK